MSKILLTRPRASSERWAKLLSARGLTPVIEPLLAIEPTGAARPFGEFQAVLLTSANAPDALEIMKDRVGDLFPLPCFCVGASTASAARAIGFINITQSTSDSAALAQMIVNALTDKTKPLLHIAGDVVDGKARSILEKNGFTLESWAVYRAVAMENLSPGLIAALQTHDVTVVPVFSPRSARVLVSLIEKNRLPGACAGLTAVGLSQAVADVLQILPWRALRIAKAPSEEEMLACLQTELAAMTEKEAPALPAPPAAKKKSRFGWVILGLIAIAGVGVVKFYPWQKFLPQTTAEAPVTQPRMAEPVAEIIPVQKEEMIAPQRNEIAALNDKIAALEAQIAQLQNKNGNSIAAFAAFEDLRDVARQGHSIAAPLAALHTVAKDDAMIADQIAKLDIYKSGTPVLSQLRVDLNAKEAHVAAPENDSAETGAWGRLQKIMRPLILVRPLHDPQFTSLETALDNGDAAAALSAFEALPAATQQNLGTWGAQLQARTAIDAAIANLDAHFTGISDALPVRGTP
jgi:uroporphyrinogen-III synthase